MLEWNPFPDAVAAEPKLVQVWHLSGQPDPAAVEALLAADTAPDVVVAKGEEIVVHYANGVHASKADRVLRRHSLGVDATARNWRTLTALCEMTAEHDLAVEVGLALRVEHVQLRAPCLADHRAVDLEHVEAAGDLVGVDVAVVPVRRPRAADLELRPSLTGPRSNQRELLGAARSW